MGIETLNGESVLRFYENIRIQVAADRASGGRYHLLGNTAKQHADILREEIDRRRLRADRIDWP
ncbi:hypothetical protein IVB48_05580 [Bradyrhizobium sp. 76]|nr:hypothetical protein [Bradyrhizobium sp. 76]MCK1404919.1 hypothetical protein [Bradyrhizobium sp. 76]